MSDPIQNVRLVHYPEPGGRGAGEWAVIGCDHLGVTVEKTGADPEVLADALAPWAQQEADKWPDKGLVYMLIEPELVEAARALEAIQ